MRIVPLLVTTLLLAAPVFGQQASSANSKITESRVATNYKPHVIIVNGKRVEVVKAPQYPPPPAHPITAEQVHEIVELTHINDVLHENMLNNFSALKQSYPPYVPEDVFIDILKQSEKFDLEPIMRAAYQKYISTEDAARIIAFYKTPAGQHFITAMPAVERDMLRSVAQEGTKLGQRVFKAHADEIRAAAAKYKAEHPDSPSITSPN